MSWTDRRTDYSSAAEVLGSSLTVASKGIAWVGLSWWEDSRGFVNIRRLQVTETQPELASDRREGFPGGTGGKEPTCQSRRRKRHGFDPWVGKVPWRRAWQPIPGFLPGESHAQRSLVGYSPWSCKESDTTEVTLHARRLGWGVGGQLGSGDAKFCAKTVLGPPWFPPSNQLSALT